MMIGLNVSFVVMLFGVLGVMADDTYAPPPPPPAYTSTTSVLPSASGAGTGSLGGLLGGLTGSSGSGSSGGLLGGLTGSLNGVTGLLGSLLGGLGGSGSGSGTSTASSESGSTASALPVVESSVVTVPSAYVPPPAPVDDGDARTVGGVLTTLPVLGTCGVGANPVSYSTTVFTGYLTSYTTVATVVPSVVVSTIVTTVTMELTKSVLISSVCPTKITEVLSFCPVVTDPPVPTPQYKKREKREKRRGWDM